ncbi:hypothetical protein [Marinobacter sp. X15-166B]|uniref:hypothetical protein n=1 Tax=Marinobacter sp. X15-166B TaxID=1897620 RepID=UPI00085BB872|nr:hypothetical protein [Marinobacter sp. X15-166B]OEY65328.1 hypothetical protein BG841_01860 [Marinobacter sp. X15-166B]
MIDSSVIKGVLRKVAAAIIGLMLALVLLTALLIAGFVLLVQAATLALSPWVGEAGALGITGLGCFVLLALFFYRLTRPATAPGNTDAGDGEGEHNSPVARLRRLIRTHPWEAVLAAFAIGFVEHGDTRLRSLLLQGGMVLMRQSDGAAGEHASEPASSTPPGADG